MRYYFTQDPSSHWYLLPVKFREEFEALSEIACNDDEAGYDAGDIIDTKFGEYRTGGGIGHITFENPKEEKL